MAETINTPEQSLTPEQWEAAFSAMEGMGLSAETSARADQVAQMTGEGMLRTATALHTVLAPDVRHEPTTSAMHVQSPDGVNRQTLMGPGERSAFFDHAAGLIQKMAAERHSVADDEAFLKRAANVTALAIVLTHTFADANGRTSRTLAHLIRQGYDTSGEKRADLKTVGSNRPSSGFKINSYLPIKQGQGLSPQVLLEAAASIDLPLDQQAAYLERKNQNFMSPYSD